MARLRTTRPVPSEDAHSTRSVSQLKATERAYHALRDSISQGTLGTDRWYLQEELAATLELSRTPVREALRPARERRVRPAGERSRARRDPERT